MKNEHITPNPYPVKPPPNMPAPRKESLEAEVARLKAEVERLTKAGDKMAKRTEFFQKRWDADELCQEVEAWNAAKEGKQP
jgi:hypothetical protein